MGDRPSIGEVVTGILLQESPKAPTLGRNDGSTRELDPLDNEERKAAFTSIMPEGPVKMPLELRDLLTYLLISGAL